jgi:hypothetical protein
LSAYRSTALFATVSDGRLPDRVCDYTPPYSQAMPS